ncbi:EP300-interacting inhibitor of differentiation 3-like [Takifugu rubripes]|uniref:Non-structural maintenance of chromosomes element 4 n=1 Tax=Takifugu rubripes TaxID=31033 RepID=A0A6D2XVV3_TAKRU|nr:EP300-interacting inhibitor of differentiation 3-like [Takifugu rubripes]XP_011611347.2 EP300-interacting inhibitor of differentiation 3-like [Takifugu rubripes]XP_011611349.2 EP300-interacting inhibitor of differentiation 3-like [Takifugu rubripes]
MKRSCVDGDDGSSHRDGSDGRKKVKSEAEVGGFPLDSNEPESSPNCSNERLQLRSRYRELIATMQKNREDMLNPSNNALTDILVEANELFKDVRQVREAALDAQLLVVATDLAKEKATQICSGSDFDPNIFAEHLLSFMGLNRLGDRGDEQQDGRVVDGYLSLAAWQRLARRAECCFRTAPSFHFMNGAFHAKPPPPKPRMQQERKDPSKEVIEIKPIQKLEGSHQEATETEVERILGYLQCYYRDEPTSPISYYEFVIDPNSFSRTIENIFHTSFLIRDGFARIYPDDSNLPCIEPTEVRAMEDGDLSNRKQCIISLSPKTWKELIDAFEIKNAMIQPPNE